MTPVTRRKLPARRWLIPLVDALEARALMTVSAMHPALIATPVEVSNKDLHAEKVAHSKVHAAVVSDAKVKHVTSESVKAKTATVKPKVKAVKTSTTHVDYVSKTGLIRAQVLNKPQGGGAPVPGALTPPEVAGAYGVTALGLANEGQGQTIGIVDEYNDPNITADANVFSTQYGLQKFNVTGGPTMTVYKDTALGSVPNSPDGGAGTSIETSLDVEWAHAMAPKANILLVEVPASGSIDNEFVELLAGVQYAASHGASVVSLSYGYPEESIGLPALYSQNLTYLAPGTAASNIAVTVSTGDYSLPLFPASSPNVIGVGGTQLHIVANIQYGSEIAWGGVFGDGAGGGGETAFFKAPSFQTANGVNYGLYRNLPDVSLNADPISGVSVYDSYDTSSNDGNPWTAVGGTSLASPLFAGMLSIVQEDRVAANKPLLTSVQINTAMYGLYKSPSYLTYFHDITSGNNSDPEDNIAGHSTTKGYDLATGIGSPIANELVPYLVSIAS